ncbi:MAG TPA: YfhO family protein [Thermoanaerobaculia bacterium]|nr:YfhO family protein [Thermoanaerobaculia bacterium]
MAFTGKALLTGRVYAPIDLPYASEPLWWMKEQYGIGRMHNPLLSDVYSHNMPWKYAVRAAYRSGEAPLWNPGIFAGDVLAAAAQPAAFDPLLLLSLLVPLPNSLTFLATMTFFIAGLGMFALLRDLRARSLASLGGAAAWMFSMFIAFWLEWALAGTIVWLPFVILGVRRVIHERSLRAAGLLAVGFVMMLLAGHPETALHVVATGMAWAAAELIGVRGKGFVRAALLAIGAGAVALCVCAIYLLPVWEALPQTYEHAMREQFYATLDKSVPMPLAIARLEAQLVPFVFGSPEHEWPEPLPALPPLESAYCGSAALALAMFGLWRSPSRAKWAALVFIIGGVMLAAEMSPLADLVSKLPLFDISKNERFGVVGAFGIALLAGLGLDAMWRTGNPACPDRRDRLSSTLPIIAIAVAIVLAIACANAWERMRAIGLSEEFVQRHAAILIVAPILVAVIALTTRGRVACALLVLLFVAQRTIESADLYPTLPARAFYPPIPLLEELPKGGEPFRIVGQHAALIPNTATLYGLEDVRGYQALKLLRWFETMPIWSYQQGVWWNRVDDLTEPFLSMLNVRYALAPHDVAVAPGWRQLAQQHGTKLLENTRVLGRAYVPRRVRIGYDKKTVLEDMAKETDFAERSWIEARRPAPSEESNGPGRVRVERKRSAELLIHASMQGGGWVVISQTAWNGWRASVDGTPAPLRYANHTVLGVYVPQGEHVVRLVYRPRGFVIGAWVSGCTLVVLLGFAVARFRGFAVRHRVTA